MRRLKFASFTPLHILKIQSCGCINLYAGDPGLIPGSWRSAGKGIGYPFQYSWASMLAQMVKNLSAIVGDLGWEDPLEKEMATHSSILAWRIPMDRGAWRATVQGVAKSWATKQSTRYSLKNSFPFLPPCRLQQPPVSASKKHYIRFVQK